MTITTNCNYYTLIQNGHDTGVPTLFSYRTANQLKQALESEGLSWHLDTGTSENYRLNIQVPLYDRSDLTTPCTSWEESLRVCVVVRNDILDHTTWVREYTSSKYDYCDGEPPSSQVNPLTTTVSELEEIATDWLEWLDEVRAADRGGCIPT